MNMMAATQATAQEAGDATPGPSTSLQPPPVLTPLRVINDDTDFNDFIELLDDDELVCVSDEDDEIQVVLRKRNDQAKGQDMWGQNSEQPVDMTTHVQRTDETGMWTGQEVSNWTSELADLQNKAPRRGKARAYRNRVHRDLGREIGRAKQMGETLRTSGVRMTDWAGRVQELCTKQQEKLQNALTVTSAQARRIQELRVALNLTKPNHEFKKE
jgi:hypothetical protein